MACVHIQCPHCGFSREMDEGTIPAGVERATCPRCRESFPLREAMRMAEPAPPGPVPPSLPRPRAPHRLRFSFSGTARDYFGIWIVNTLLKIVTLGIYSAWAKVRKLRYFYGCTQLGGACFDYLADPLALFRGWLIGALFFILYSVGTRVSPFLASTLGMVFFAAMPGLVVRSRMFNQRNSSHRNIRFNFVPKYDEGYLVFAGLPMLLPFTLGLLFPYIVYRQKRFLVENSEYGMSGFAFDATAREYYLVFLKAVGWFLLILVLIGAGAFFFSATIREFSPLLFDNGRAGGEAVKRGAAAVAVAVLIAVNLIYLYVAIYVRTELANLTWNSTRIRDNRFVSTLRVRDMAWLYLSSAVAIFLSLGLLIPWASIRLTRYRIENLSLQVTGDLESFVAVTPGEIGSAGEEIGDIFGVDVAL
ncbi:MAG TPA: DUF898 family protein [Desulfuromonadaceae bacterium]